MKRKKMSVLCVFEGEYAREEEEEEVVAVEYKDSDGRLR